MALQGLAPAAGEVAERKLAAAHQAFLATPGLQREFPAVVPPKPPPAWLRVIGEIIEALLPVLKYLFWGGLILGAILIGVLVVREILASRRPDRVSPTPADWRPSAEAARALLEDADRLAAEGRFAEAARILLFRSIEDLSGRRPGVVRPDLTSRDIARLEAAPAAARSAFARIAEAVERSFFGGRALGPEEFAQARRDYETFAFAEGWT